MSRRPARRPTPPPQSPLPPPVRELLGLDLRSLAAFRIALASLLLVDLASRARYLDVTSTDQGILPVALVWNPSLHTLSGSYGYQLALLLFATLFAALLLVGLYTRLAALGSWILMASLLYRNPYLTDGGDVFAAKLLLWSVFLPLGARFSLDARRRPRAWPPGPLVVSAATLGLIAEFVYLYASAGSVKASPEWRDTYTALEHVMGQTYWIRPAGTLLGSHPDLLRLLTPTVRLFELLGPALLFVPIQRGPVRCATVLAFLGFQLGLWLCIQLNLFPFFSSSAAIALLPGWLWRRLRVPDDGGAAGRTAPWWDVPAAVLLLCFAVSALAPGRMPEPIGRVLDWASVTHRWTMYARAPRQDFRFEVTGTLADGTRASLLDAPATGGWDRVERAHESYRLKYFLQKVTGRREVLDAYLAWICREWNAEREPAARLVSVGIAVDVWQILPRSAPERRPLASRTCAAP